METIPILTVVDCQSVIDKVGGNDNFGKANPVNLGSYGTSDLYLYMLTTQSFVVSEQGQSELTVKAQVGQSVQWAMTCIGAGTQYNVIIQGITPSPATAISTPFSLPLTTERYVSAPDGTPTAESYKEYLMQATVENVGTGSIQYYVNFTIVDTSGNTLGYYQWDPFISVTN
jgi:hypothetical protein